MSVRVRIDPVRSTPPPAPARVRRRTRQRLQPAPARTLWMMKVDPSAAAILHDRQATGERFAQVTGLLEQESRLRLGSLSRPVLAVVDLP